MNQKILRHRIQKTEDVSQKKSRENPMMANGAPRMNKSRKDAIEMISRWIPEMFDYLEAGFWEKVGR